MSSFRYGRMLSIRLSPRPMFWCQLIATIVAGTVQLGVQAWMFTNIKEMCSQEQDHGFTCPSTEVFGTASIIWGVIGPARQFSQGQIYYGLVFFFLAGFLAPFITVSSSLYFMKREHVLISCAVVARAEEVPQHSSQVHQLARHLQRHRPHPARDAVELYHMVCRGLHL